MIITKAKDCLSTRESISEKLKSSKFNKTTTNTISGDYNIGDDIVDDAEWLEEYYIRKYGWD